MRRGRLGVGLGRALTFSDMFIGSNQIVGVMMIVTGCLVELVALRVNISGNYKLKQARDVCNDYMSSKQKSALSLLIGCTPRGLGFT
ncbi:MAG: hypothetical protein AAGA77_05935 [Bacteroidota bacterium]